MNASHERCPKFTSEKQDVKSSVIYVLKHFDHKYEVRTIILNALFQLDYEVSFVYLSK